MFKIQGRQMPLLAPLVALPIAHQSVIHLVLLCK